MEVMEAIKTRRSVRKYKAVPVDDELVEMVLEAARWAPSWANSQCWKFVVVRDDRIKNELADTIPSDNPAGRAIRQAPVTIVACAEREKSGYYQGKPSTDKGDWYMFDVGLAMQNLILAAHSLGLGTVHVGYFDAQKAAAILNVPPGVCVVEMTPLGYPDQEPKQRPRKELSEIVCCDKYDKKE